MGVLCCSPGNSPDPFSKKIIFMTQNATEKNYSINIFDVEKNKYFKFPAALTKIKSLDGISQINYKNNLYLCGTNDDNSKSFNSYLLMHDIISTNKKPLFLLKSLYSHYYPSLIFFKKDYIFVIGGRKQRKCEYYNIAIQKWTSIAKLPEERYKCTLLSDEKNGYIYLFGGMSLSTSKNISTILRLSIGGCEEWNVINVKENPSLLERNSSVAFMFDECESIYICGGVNELGGNTEYIVEYNIKENTIKKREWSLRKKSAFDIQGCIDLNKQYFSFWDNENYIHSISKREFKISIFGFDSFYE